MGVFLVKGASGVGLLLRRYPPPPSTWNEMSFQVAMVTSTPRYATPRFVMHLVRTCSGSWGPAALPIERLSVRLLDYYALCARS